MSIVDKENRNKAYVYMLLKLIALIFGLYELYLLFVPVESSFITALVVYVLLVYTLYFITIKLSIPKKYSLTLLAIIFSLFIAECFLRFVLGYPKTYTEQNGGEYISQFKSPDNLVGKENISTLQFEPFRQRNYSSSEFDYPSEKLNEYGFRGEIPNENSRVILALGDSFTEGIGAPGDSTYPKILQGLLKKEHESYAIFNGGTAGNDPFFDFMMLKKLYNKFNSNEVLFLINTSDVNDVVIRGGLERFTENGIVYRKAPFWEPLYAVSFVFRLIAHNLFDINYNLMTYEKNDQLNIQAVESIASLFENEISPWSKEHQLDVKVVLHPFISEMESSYYIYDSLSSKMSKIEGLAFYNCRPEFMSTINDPKEIYWMKDRHFNPRGYSLLARFIFENMYKGKD